MKKLNLLTLSLIASLMLMFSCKMSTEKAKEKLDDATQNTIDQITELKNTEFGNAFYGILNVGVPEINAKSFAMNEQNISKIKNLGINVKNNLFNKFPKIFNNKFGSEQFSLTQYAGTYTWSSSDTSWEKSASPSDKIIVVFPSKYSTTNDCRLEWSKYSEIKCNDDEYYPTVIYVELFKDDKSIGLIDVTMSYNTVNSLPITADATLKLEPMSFNLKYKFENKILTVNTSMNKGIRRIDDLDATITFNNDNMDEVMNGSGVFKTYKIDNAMNLSVLLKIKFDFDYAAMSDNMTCTDFNNNVHVLLYASSDRYIGKVICTDDDCGATIVFDDGTTQCSDVYFDKLANAIEISLQTK